MRRLSRARFQEELDRILEGLRQYRPLKVILFGSFARGDDHALSDIDLVIVKETDRPFAERTGDVLALCDYSIPLEPLVYTPEELARLQAEGNPFIEQVLREGKVIYES
ncbi:MAG TPA: nucleotidyltransferase domain-containing protein [Anaerolineales bacterium]|nr:nucleotidyltransferase domain-containing protein [Anaerolineae bacterium]HIQ00523.1 nucleotidyltransferase domain-containing protein [Anaerolineales bacterium]